MVLGQHRLQALVLTIQAPLFSLPKRWLGNALLRERLSRPRVSDTPGGIRLKLHTLLVTLTALAPLAGALGGGLPLPTEDNDAYSGGDAGDTKLTATPLRNPEDPGTAEGSYPGRIHKASDDEDWYTFQYRGSPDGQPLKIGVSMSSPQCGLPEAPVATTPVEIRLEPRFLLPGQPPIDQWYADSPCEFEPSQRQIDLPAGDLYIVVRYLPPKAGTSFAAQENALGPLAVQTAAQATVEADYVLELGCKPYC